MNNPLKVITTEIQTQNLEPRQTPIQREHWNTIEIVDQKSTHPLRVLCSIRN